LLGADEFMVEDAAGELYDGDDACGADGCSVGIAECQSPEPAVGAVVGEIAGTCGVIGGVGGIPPAPGGISPDSRWWGNSPDIKLGGAMPWNPAAFNAPEAGPGLKPMLPGLSIDDGAEGEIAGENPGPPPGA
jgi:hypothetical protein